MIGASGWRRASSASSCRDGLAGQIAGGLVLGVLQDGRLEFRGAFDDRVQLGVLQCRATQSFTPTIGPSRTQRSSSARLACV